MTAWIVKGKASRNDFASNLRVGATERWVTRRPPRDWAIDDQVFMWSGAPSTCVIGLATIVGIEKPNIDGDSFFTLRYRTTVLPNTLGIEILRSDPILSNASFLKAGAAGTLFKLTDSQANHLDALVRRANPKIEIAEPSERATDTTASPKIALSIRQPWAELIMRGIKTIEARTRPTHKRERVHVYAGMNRASELDEERVTEEYGLNIDSLPRGVLVGTVEIIGCRDLLVSDSAAAAFPVAKADRYFAWLLANPVRALRLVPPTQHPQPAFFRPF